MPGRDPEAAERSVLIAEEIRAEMKRQGLTGAELRDRVAKLRGQTEPPNAMWMTRRLNGAVNLVEPVKVVYGPTGDLEDIAKVLDVDPKKFVRVLNRKPNTQPAAAGN